MTIRKYTDYSEAEISALYAAVGWSAYTEKPDTLREAFRNSMIVLAAYEGEKLAGIIRVVGDGCTVVFIQDLLVHPEYQRRGIGSALLKSILDRYSRVRQIELVTDNTPGTVAFYRSMGFRELSGLNCCGFMKIQA